MTDLQTIIFYCKANDDKYREMLYKRFYGYALKIVFRYIYRYERATDVVNDGFVKVFTHFSKFEAPSAEDSERMLMGWIRRIMVNCAIDELRKEVRIPQIGELTDAYWNEQAAEHADDGILHKELIEQVKKLPAAYRAVFNMYVVDGYSHKEIAEHLDISIGTSKSHLSRAKEQLRKFIDNTRIDPLYATSR